MHKISATDFAAIRQSAVVLIMHQEQALKKSAQKTKHRHISKLLDPPILIGYSEFNHFFVFSFYNNNPQETLGLE